MPNRGIHAWCPYPVNHHIIQAWSGSDILLDLIALTLVTFSRCLSVSMLEAVLLSRWPNANLGSFHRCRKNMSTVNSIFWSSTGPKPEARLSSVSSQASKSHSWPCRVGACVCVSILSADSIKGHICLSVAHITTRPLFSSKQCGARLKMHVPCENNLAWLSRVLINSPVMNTSLCISSGPSLMLGRSRWS